MPPFSSDPLPLNDDCARYVLSVMVLFLRPPPPTQSMLDSPFTDLTFRDIESTTLAVTGSVEPAAEPPLTPTSHSIRSKEVPLRTQASSNSVRSSKGSLSSTVLIPGSGLGYEKTHISLVKSILPVNTLISKYAGKVVFQVSASNYGAVYARLRQKIHSLERGTAELSDHADLQLMAHSVLDRSRLVQLLMGMSVLMRSVRY
jgi:hypothetical protein